MSKNILTFGITDLDAYPNLKCGVCWKEVMQDDTLCIPCQKPDIEEIDSIHLNVCVTDFKIIRTIQGYKLIIEGIKKYKIMYTANTCEQSVHSAHWESHFCEFVLLSKNFYIHNFSISDVFIGIEDIVVKYNDKRMIDVSIFLIICPVIKSATTVSTTTPEDYPCSPKNTIPCKDNPTNKKYLSNKYNNKCNNNNNKCTY